MPFQGKFIIEGEGEHNLLNVQISISRSIDANGRPNGLPTGGLIYLSISSTEATNPFWNWMIAPQTTKDGSIKYSSEEGKPTRTITFCNAYCVDYSENFNDSGSSPMIVSLVISAEKIGNGTDILNKNWGGPQ